ncbi:MAG: hypothetical protein EBU70_13675, partial [Actinobacteria bacterium]|nr:hypothetical protein [Actinomycetota bacterium]
LGRNEAADIRHARDADTIAGDNANIYRLVGINGQAGSGYLSFNYDSAALNGQTVAGTLIQGYDANLKIIPRAVELLDYTAGGMDFAPAQAVNDIGAGDEVHGEAGDDTVYGQRGNDVVFGDAGDDDLIGGMGHDWISGGTGQDGVLGDDGRIVTSRNTTAGEPLSGAAGIPAASQNLVITTPGKIQQATINITNDLRKTVNLTPFYATTAGNSLFDAADADDLIFGGLGDDFLHGGVGDDGISGGEALALSYALNATFTGVVRSDFDRPFNPGDLLRYDATGYDERRPDRTGRAGEFAMYDEYSPRGRLFVDAVSGRSTLTDNGYEWLLNPSATEGTSVGVGIFSDGDDAIFGDLGHDWLAGGTGRDNLYGGYGNDLLNADDDLRTADVPDTSASYEDLAFGGAGRDVL